MLKETRLEIRGELRKILNWGRNTSEVAPMLRECAKIWREWLAERYERNAGGHGDWTPLRPSTIAQKRRKGSKYPEKILVDTELLFDSLREETIIGFKDFPHYGMGKHKTISTVKKSISIGLGLAKYPNGMTVDEVAEIHQYGGPNLPARPIFVEPPPIVQERMASAVVDMMLKAWGSG